MTFITGRNEVVAKVIFLHLFVILFTGGGFCLSACWDTTPPGADTTPPPREQTSPLGPDPPGTRLPRGRHHPLPPGPDTPPGPDPPGKQTPAYSLRVASMHPTAMHSCYLCKFQINYHNLKKSIERRTEY